jgi:UDP-N-acetylmuramoyl-tripeptide--D-alanyl-D-alanine ligase
MLELGIDSIFYHKDLGKYIKDKDIDKVYTYGNDSKYIGYTCNKISNHYEDKELLIKDLKEELSEDTVIYFKASRGIKLEEIIDKL